MSIKSKQGGVLEETSLKKQRNAFEKPDEIDLQTPTGIGALICHYSRGISLLLQWEKEEDQLPLQRYEQKKRFNDEIYTLLGRNATLKDIERQEIGTRNGEESQKLKALKDNAQALIKIIKTLNRLPSDSHNSPYDSTWKVYTINLDIYTSAFQARKRGEEYGRSVSPSPKTLPKGDNLPKGDAIRKNDHTGNNKNSQENQENQENPSQNPSKKLNDFGHSLENNRVAPKKEFYSEYLKELNNLRQQLGNSNNNLSKVKVHICDLIDPFIKQAKADGLDAVYVTKFDLQYLEKSNDKYTQYDTTKKYGPGAPSKIARDVLPKMIDIAKNVINENLYFGGV